MAPEVKSLKNAQGNDVVRQMVIDYIDQFISDHHRKYMNFRGLTSDATRRLVAEHFEIPYVRPASSTIKTWITTRITRHAKVSSFNPNMPQNHQAIQNQLDGARRESATMRVLMEEDASAANMDDGANDAHPRQSRSINSNRFDSEPVASTSTAGNQHNSEVSRIKF